MADFEKNRVGKPFGPKGSRGLLVGRGQTIPISRDGLCSTMIEIKGFLETSFLDWRGKLCSVLFLPRCNFRCPYCHNHTLVLHPDQLPTLSLESIFARIHSLRAWIDGVCLTGGEPTLHDDLPLLIREIKKQGFSVKLDTNGSNPEKLEGLIEAKEVDFVSMDVKAPLDPFHYSRATGLTGKLEPVLESVKLLKRERVEYEFRMTAVPGFHREEDILALGNQLKAGKRFILQNFNPENPLDPSLRNVVPYDQKVLKAIETQVQEMK